MSIQHALDSVNELVRKYKLLKYQYGIASNTIHQLRAENALLREKNRELTENPLKFAINATEKAEEVITLAQLKAQGKTVEDTLDGFSYASGPAVFFSDDAEPPTNMILVSHNPLYPGEDPFKVKYSNNAWWALDSDGMLYSHASWDFWVKNYGPFTEVVDAS